MVVTSKPDDGRRRTGGREEVMVAVVDGQSIIQTPVVLRAFFRVAGFDVCSLGDHCPI